MMNGGLGALGSESLYLGHHGNIHIDPCPNVATRNHNLLLTHYAPLLTSRNGLLGVA